jgi:CheY-like chemotaxis protein
VAEDEVAVRDVLLRTLHAAGYNVLEACDGEDAVRIVKEYPAKIHMAILDVMMPKLGGREAMDRIKIMRPEMRFLFCSGYSESAIHTNFVIDEGVRLISKPYSGKLLLHVAREILDGAN